MSLQVLEKILHAANDVTPLGLAVLLTVIVLLMVHKRGPIRKMQDNHIAHLQMSLDRIADNSDKQLETLNDVRADIGWLKGRLTH